MAQMTARAALDAKLDLTFWLNQPPSCDEESESTKVSQINGGRMTSPYRVKAGNRFLVHCARLIATISRLRGAAIELICYLEGGQVWSQSFRQLIKFYYGIEIGAYSYGPCLKPGRLPAGTRIGNYCSLGPNIQVFRRNHPLHFASLHPFFFNSRLGVVERDSIELEQQNPLNIMHDVWIGADTIITPGCHYIGIGAVVAAGAVLTKDVSAYTVVGGNPAKFIKKRFTEEVCSELLRSCWWKCELSELLPVMPFFLKVIDIEDARRIREYVSSLGKTRDELFAEQEARRL